MTRAGFAGFLPVLLIWSVSGAQMRQASESEISLIRDALLLDQTPEWSHYEILEIQAAFTSESGDRPSRLDGWIYFEPYRIEFDLCMMVASFITGLEGDGGYDWNLGRFAYWNWIASAGDDCRIAERSRIPVNAVQSDEPIPSASLSFALANADELLQSAFRSIIEEFDEAESTRQRILGYRENDSYRLERIALTELSSPEFGFAFFARFVAPGVYEGPSVVFSITPTGFLVHRVSFWIV